MCGSQTDTDLLALEKRAFPVERQVLVILDPAYGERLREAGADRPVWIERSPGNEVAVRTLWAEEEALDLSLEITLMEAIPGPSAEELLLLKLATIELHHGCYSMATPYTELEVVGGELTRTVQMVLEQLGFRDFIVSAVHFVAKRSPQAVASVD